MKDVFGAIGSLLWHSIEIFFTCFYQDLIRRNTLDPLTELCQEHNQREVNDLLREWSQRKHDESKHIQVAVR